MSRPVGGILSTGPLPATGWVVIPLSGLPGDIGRAGRPTFDLAPGGVYQAVRVTPDAGALLPHRFTLTRDSGRSRTPLAVCFLWHFPAGRPDWPLASTLPYGVPTFLDQVVCPITRAAWPRPPGQLTHSNCSSHLALLSRQDHHSSPPGKAVGPWRYACAHAHCGPRPSTG